MTMISVKQYRDFWDIPRMFWVENNCVQYLFDCKFDEHKEDYDDKYYVYRMPDLPDDALIGSWKELPNAAIEFLGTITINDVKFDESRRALIDDKVLARFA